MTHPKPPTAAPADAHSNSLDIDAFIPYMRNVTRCEASLRELNLMWRLIESVVSRLIG